MKKITAMIAVLALALVLLTACGTKAPNVVGTWQAEWMGATLELTFNDDGSYTSRQYVEGEWEQSTSGTYSVNGSKMTWSENGQETAAEVSISGQKSGDVETLSIGYSANADGQDQAYIITYTRK
ncbi:MAG: hypothetical protein IK127_02180 [Clostridia bacterium]|nr:hypothetical protein [Clostridia bacterium]